MSRRSPIVHEHHPFGSPGLADGFVCFRRGKMLPLLISFLRAWPPGNPWQVSKRLMSLCVD